MVSNYNVQVKEKNYYQYLIYIFFTILVWWKNPEHMRQNLREICLITQFILIQLIFFWFESAFQIYGIRLRFYILKGERYQQRGDK